MGFKLWVRTGISGMLCDFDVYQGSVDGIRQAKSELGLSGDVVMKLTSTLPKGQNYKIYADFTGVPLVVKLLECGIHYVGTVRQVRLPNCNIEDEKILKKKGRGSFDVRVEGNHNICTVKWPYIVGTYNKHMGGVDLLDSFAAKYKFPMKSHH
ncbi:hypothetical protein cypCar_00042679 [Cyprinus carpio]|nr:hypothetical protein cypCar_00042679 [Cyprinus carpio]